MAHGWITPAQLDDALKTAQKLADLGLREKIGAILVKKGYLTAAQVKEVLLAQGKRARNRIKGYEILSKLGQGGMGAVFKARQVSLDREVALKVLFPNLAKDRSYVARFLREARAVAKLNHKHIIQGIDVGESGGHYYFAMEFVDGPTLQEIIRSKGPVPEERALKIAGEVAQALSHAHKHKLIHRDVKPDNIMINSKGDAKLCDLGLAKFQASGTSAASREGEGLVFGTPHYISPEQAKGESTVDIRSDIYSLGATLFHVLTGQTPFPGGRSAAVMAKHVTEPVRDPRDLNPGISEGAARLVLKMMAKRPEDRHPDPRSLLEDIRRVAKGKSPKGPSGAGAGAGTGARSGSRASARAAARASSRSSARSAAEPSAPPVIEHRHHRKASKRAKRPDALQYVIGAAAFLVIVVVVMWLLKLGMGKPSSSGPRSTRPRATSPERPQPGGAGSAAESAHESSARVLFERATRFAAAKENSENFPEIFRRLGQVEQVAPGTAYAEKARRRRAVEERRQAGLRRERFAEVRRQASALVEKGKYGKAYELWGQFPVNLLPEDEDARRSVIESGREPVVEAAQARFGEIVEKSLAAAETGQYDAARAMLGGAGRIGIPWATEGLAEARKQLEQAITRHQTGAARQVAVVWGERRGTILRLARAGEYEQALASVRLARREKRFASHQAELAFLEYDMQRMSLRQEIALEAYASKAGTKERVYVHKGSRGYSGKVLKVDGDRIVLRPSLSGSKTITITKQELSPDDIRKYAQIILADAAGNYDYAILLIYSGNAAQALPYLKRCRRDPQIGERARRHLAALAKSRTAAPKRRPPVTGKRRPTPDRTERRRRQ